MRKSDKSIINRLSDQERKSGHIPSLDYEDGQNLSNRTKNLPSLLINDTLFKKDENKISKTPVKPTLPFNLEDAAV